MAKKKREGRKDEQIHKIIHRKLKIEQHEPTKNRGELKCSGRVSSACSTCGPRRVSNASKNTMISLVRGCHNRAKEDGIVVTTIGTYTWSSVLFFFVSFVIPLYFDHVDS